MRSSSLLIMAAGIGSRFGGGIKQLEPVGLHDELIIDYSIHDAIQAGFTKIVIVIRKEIEQDFKSRVGDRINKICKEHNICLSYCFQDSKDIPGTFPEGRLKPWGTGQAVLSAKSIIKEPFAVINADDYYGKNAFIKMHEWLEKSHDSDAVAMAGFVLENTLSDFGGVTRGVCSLSAEGDTLLDIVETKNIIKTIGGAEADGKSIDVKSIVSMNFWGFPGNEEDTPAYIKSLEAGFEEFFKVDVLTNPLKAEFLLPVHIGKLLNEKRCHVDVLKTNDKWFGVTYQEDKELVVKNIIKLIESGVYSEDLYSDL